MLYFNNKNLNYQKLIYNYNLYNNCSIFFGNKSCRLLSGMIYNDEKIRISNYENKICQTEKSNENILLYEKRYVN